LLANAVYNGVYHDGTRPARGLFILLSGWPKAKIVAKPKLAAPSTPLAFEDAPAILRFGCTSTASLVHPSKALLSVREINIRRGTGANVERYTASPIPHNAQLFDTSTE
jgi:hypothetical protein